MYANYEDSFALLRDAMLSRVEESVLDGVLAVDGEGRDDLSQRFAVVVRHEPAHVLDDEHSRLEALDQAFELEQKLAARVIEALAETGVAE